MDKSQKLSVLHVNITQPNLCHWYPSRNLGRGEHNDRGFTFLS